jgi:hypothetical protein
MEVVQTQTVETSEVVPMQQTPVDELTGLPLLIAPQNEVPYLLIHPGVNAARRAAGRRDYIDRNHVYHPSTQLVSVAEKALQGSRIQYVLRQDHDDYHFSYEGPPLPQTSAEKYYQMVFSAANYIPRRALDFSGDSPTEITLTDDQILRYQTSGEVRMADPGKVGKFLEGYVLADPEFSHIPVHLIDEFLTIGTETADDLRRRRYLAHQLLSYVIDATTEPMYQAYKRALEDNIWKPALNTSPRHVVHEQIIGRGQHRRLKAISKVGGVLLTRLAAFRGVEPASVAA